MSIHIWNYEVRNQLGILILVPEEFQNTVLPKLQNGGVIVEDMITAAFSPPVCTGYTTLSERELVIMAVTTWNDDGGYNLKLEISDELFPIDLTNWEES